MCPEQYEEAQSFNHEVFIFTPEGEHVAMKRNGWYPRMRLKTLGTKPGMREEGAKKKTKVVCHTTLIFDITNYKKIQDGEPKKNVLQREMVFKAMERNCVVEVIEYFYQFKKVKENQNK